MQPTRMLPIFALLLITGFSTGLHARLPGDWRAYQVPATTDRAGLLTALRTGAAELYDVTDRLISNRPERYANSQGPMADGMTRRYQAVQSAEVDGRQVIMMDEASRPGHIQLVLIDGVIDASTRAVQPAQPETATESETERDQEMYQRAMQRWDRTFPDAPEVRQTAMEEMTWALVRRFSELPEDERTPVGDKALEVFVDQVGGIPLEVAPQEVITNFALQVEAPELYSLEESFTTFGAEAKGEELGERALGVFHDAWRVHGPRDMPVAETAAASPPESGGGLFGLGNLFSGD